MKNRMLSALFFVILPALAIAAEPRVIEVKLDSYTIKPDKITVKVGESVILKVKNEASFIPHNLVIKAPQAGVDIKIDVSAGKTSEASFTATQPGSYEMLCDKTPPIVKSHKEKGMHGTLVVE
jgi:plastocyanin